MSISCCFNYVAISFALLGAPFAMSQPPAESVSTDEPLFKLRQPPANEPAAKMAAREAMFKSYALGPDAVLRVVVPPFPEERARWILTRRQGSPRMVQQIFWVRDSQTIDPALESWGIDHDEADISLLEFVRNALRLAASEIEGPARHLLEEKRRLDLVLTAGTTREQAVEPLAKALREQVKVPITMTLKNERQEVWVVSGKLKDNVPGKKYDAPLLIYGKDAPLPLQQDPQATVSHGAGWDSLFDQLGNYVGRRVVAENADAIPAGMVFFEMRRNRAMDSGSEDDVIKIVKEQTGLNFRREVRRVRVLMVGKAE